MKKVAQFLNNLKERPLLILITIMAAFFFMGVFYIWRVPPFEGPDEGQHFAYVLWLAQGNGLPPQGEEAWQTPIQQEAGQPPLYYLLASLPARLFDLENPPATYYPNPYFAAPLDRERFDNDNRAIHYPDDRQSLKGGWAAFYTARMLSLFFGLLLVASTYGMARQVLPQQPGIALGAALIVAATPQVLHIATVVSNDIPAAALSTLSLWLWAVWLSQPGKKGVAWVFWPGIVLGLAGLTKVSSLAIGAILGGGLIWLWLTGRYTKWQVIQAGFWLSLGAGLALGWWLARGWLLYGSPGGLGPHYSAPWVITNATEQLPSLLTRWLEVGRSFWLALGWGTVRPAEWVYVIYGTLVVLGLAGALVFWVRQQSGMAKMWLGILWLGVLATAVALEYWMRQVTAPHGRLLFPALAPIALTLAIGWQTLLRRWQILPYLFSGAWVLLAPIILVQAAYFPPPLLRNDELPPTTIGWFFAPQDEAPIAELLTITPDTNTLHAGDVLPVHLCWRVLRTTTQEYTLFLHLVGPENSLIGNRRSYPGQGLRPSSTWQPGQAWCEVAHMYVRENVPVTLVYQLEVGMVVEATGSRLNIFDGRGIEQSQTFVTGVKVISKTTTSQPPSNASLPLNTTNDPWQLTAFETESIWQAGTAVPLTLQWQPTAPISQDYQIFVHLRDPITGEILAQADGSPLDGWYPTSWWEPGEIVIDARQFIVPDTLLPGSYQLVAGFYDLTTTIRAGAIIDLGIVQVRE